MIWRITLIIMLSFLIVIPVSSSQNALEEPFLGTFVYLRDDHLYRYQDGGIDEVCSPSLTMEISDSERQAQYTDPWDVAYAVDSQLVAFSAHNDGLSGDTARSYRFEDLSTALYLCDLNTGGSQRISPDPFLEYGHITPAFSPDETQIAWLAIDGTNRQWNMMIYDIATSEVSVIYQPTVPIYDDPITRYFQLQPLIWGEAGIVFKGHRVEDETDILVLIDPETGIFSEQEILLFDDVQSNDTLGDVLYWTQLDSQWVVVYALGLDGTIYYYAPETEQFYKGEGALRLSPEATPSDEWLSNNGELPSVHLRAYSASSQTHLMISSSGPATPYGLPNGFAFSTDGRAMGMIVNEGFNLTDGRDLYILDSRDTFGALGYVVQAQRVGESADWGEGGVQRVFWGRSVMQVDLIRPAEAWPGNPNG